MKRQLPKNTLVKVTAIDSAGKALSTRVIESNGDHTTESGLEDYLVGIKQTHPSTVRFVLDIALPAT